MQRHRRWLIRSETFLASDCYHMCVHLQGGISVKNHHWCHFSHYVLKSNSKKRAAFVVLCCVLTLASVFNMLTAVSIDDGRFCLDLTRLYKGDEPLQNGCVFSIDC